MVRVDLIVLVQPSMEGHLGGFHLLALDYFFYSYFLAWGLQEHAGSGS